MDARNGGRPGRLRRDGAQSPGRPVVRKIKRTFSLTAESSRLLDVYALGTDREPYQVVEELIRRYCKRFVLQDRGGGEGESPAPEGEGRGFGE